MKTEVSVYGNGLVLAEIHVTENLSGAKGDLWIPTTVKNVLLHSFISRRTPAFTTFCVDDDESIRRSCRWIQVNNSALESESAVDSVEHILEGPMNGGCRWIQRHRHFPWSVTSSQKYGRRKEQAAKSETCANDLAKFSDMNPASHLFSRSVKNLPEEGSSPAAVLDAMQICADSPRRHAQRVAAESRPGWMTVFSSRVSASPANGPSLATASS